MMLITRTTTDIGPTELIRAASRACERARACERPNVRASYYTEAEKLIQAADVLRGLDREPGYQPCRLDAAATASPIA